MRIALVLAVGAVVLVLVGAPGPVRTQHGPSLRLVATLAPDGYWLIASDGGVFAYGGAAFHGSTGGTPLNAPVVGTAATPDSGGYWLVAGDGGVFAFGDAAFRGSAGGTPLNAPVVGAAPTPDGGGYWLVAADGGVFAYGDAAFHGSAVGRTDSGRAVGLAATPDGTGYWVADARGGVLALGSAVHFGSAAGLPLARPVVGLAPASSRAVDPHDYSIAGDAGSVLFPGASSAIDLRITNPNPAPITVVTNSTTVTTPSGACDPADFTMVHELLVPVVVPAESSLTLSQLGVAPDAWPTVGMVDTGSDQDACQHVELTLRYRGEAVG